VSGLQSLPNEREQLRVDEVRPVNVDCDLFAVTMNERVQGTELRQLPPLLTSPPTAVGRTSSAKHQHRPIQVDGYKQRVMNCRTGSSCMACAETEQDWKAAPSALNSKGSPASPRPSPFAAASRPSCACRVARKVVLHAVGYATELGEGGVASLSCCASVKWACGVFGTAGDKNALAHLLLELLEDECLREGLGTEV
jgi:hypothetical protein